MPASPKLHLKQQNRLLLAPSVRHALGMMQLTRLELIDHIKEVAETNPLVDMDVTAPFEPNAYDHGPYAGHSGHDEGIQLEHWISQPLDLRDHLRWQINLLGLTPAEHHLVLALIEHIDDQGLLTGSIEEATDLFQSNEPRLGITDKDVKRALSYIQKLDPIGVGATSRQESLIIQLQARYGHHPQFPLAHRLLAQGLDGLAKTDITAFSQKLDQPVSDIRQAFKLIQTLSPYPASSFESLTEQRIVPDVYVFPSSEGQNQWQIVVNHSYLPSLCINTTYSAVIGQTRDRDRQYLKDKLAEARSLISAIQLRQQTLARLTWALVTYQSGFLVNGPKSLKPLTQVQVANQLGLHVSTISRVARGKYAQTPQGLIELKRFFCRGAVQTDQQSISSMSVKTHIKSIIDSENESTPLSDEAIASRLRGKGVKIARRTVTKYREQLGIADSRVRRNQKTWM